MLWLTAGGSKVIDSQKEKDLAGLVKFTMSTDLEIKFSKENQARGKTTYRIRENIYKCYDQQGLISKIYKQLI